MFWQKHTLTQHSFLMTCDWCSRTSLLPTWIVILLYLHLLLASSIRFDSTSAALVFVWLSVIRLQVNFRETYLSGTFKVVHSVVQHTLPFLKSDVCFMGLGLLLSSLPLHLGFQQYAFRRCIITIALPCQDKLHWEFAANTAPRICDKVLSYL